GKFAPTAMIRLILKIGIFRPHIIHSHLFHADLPGRFASLLARGLKRALFISHQHIPEQRFLPMRQVLDRGTRGLVDSYLCVSQAVASHVQSQLNLPESRVTIIPNGRDLKPFLTLDLEPSQSDTWKLGTVGRLDEQKDQALLLEVLAELKKRGRRFHCVIAGEGALREPLLKQREELGLLETEVELLGRRDDVPRLLEQMDLFILTSKYEGLPIAAIEAMAAGRPIVATRVPGIIDVIEESYGCLVDYRDAKGLADEIERLMADRPLRQKMAVAGREKARSHYSRERMLRDLTAHYELLLGTRKR
ncbi:MAG: glycosyltransferase, partial [Planctomycetota bacterium]|nr:glycosyltransferase [Planctomycetota bacterium]